MTERLSEARDALQQAEREAAWREVARRLAHEFKNLLTPMSLSLHRLRRRTGAVSLEHRDAVAESLDALAGGVDQMARLAEQFSQYARLPEPRFEPVDLDRLVRSAVALHEHEGVTVKVVSENGPITVAGDSLLLSRAVHNLVLNACEASPTGATVEVGSARARRGGGGRVTDHGQGLDPGCVPDCSSPTSAPSAAAVASGSRWCATWRCSTAAARRWKTAKAAAPWRGSSCRAIQNPRMEGASG